MLQDGNYQIGIYVRESRDENGENYETIEVQRDLLIDYITKSKLGQIKRVYVDDNISGAAFNRAGLELLKKDISGSRVNMVVLKDLSRLGRNNAKTLLFLDFLEENGVRVITFDGRYDSLKDNDTVGIETWFNERYIRDISKKIRANLKFKIQKGEFLGKAPYGYKKSPSNKNSLVINEQEAPVVKSIFKMYSEGYGYRSIAGYLNKNGYSPPGYDLKNGSGKWNAAAIGRILRNRVYAGDTVQGVSEKISFKSKKTRRLPPEQWVITHDTHQPIICKEEFDRTQLQIQQRITHPHKKELHLFKGLLFCGNCGSLLYVRTRKNRPMGYICGNYAKNGSTACSSHFIREEELLCAIYPEIIKLFNDIELTAKVKYLINEQEKRDFINTSGNKSKLEQLVISKRRQQEILYTDRLEERISQQLFERMNINLEKSIMQLERDIASASEKTSTGGIAHDTLDFAIEILKRNGLSREIIMQAVERITVFEEADRDTKKKPVCTGIVQIDFRF